MAAAASSPVRVDFYYDVVSPYSWLAFEVLTRYRREWNLDLRLRPLYLGGVMMATKNRPPAMVPAKGRYMAREMKRSARHFGVPLRLPGDFQAVMMGGTLLAQRTLVAVAAARPELLEEATRQLWLRVWARDQPVTGEEHVADALVAAGTTPDQARELVAAAARDEAKAALKAATAEALKAGAFGAPAILVHAPGARRPELYFGSDRFEQIAELIGRPWHGPRHGAEARPRL